MIEHLEHKLLEFNESKILAYHPNRFIVYKCVNCNHIIFYNKDYANIYWKYEDGLDFNAANGYGQWGYSILTCNETIIKSLLE